MTAGEDAARRSIAPSISTCSAPWPSIASLTALTSSAALGPGDLDRAAVSKPRDQDAAERSAHARVLQDRMGDATHAEKRVGGGHEAAGAEVHTRLVDARVDHVALLAVAAHGGHADQPPLRLELTQERCERLGLAGVLREAHQREPPHRSGQL